MVVWTVSKECVRDLGREWQAARRRIEAVFPELPARSEGKRMDDLLLTMPIDAACIGILTRLTREATQAYIRGIVNGPGLPDSPFCTLEMPCGERLVIQTEADFPAESVPCPCGNPKHWFVKYEEEG